MNVRIRGRGKGYAAGDILQFKPGGAAGKVAAVGPAGGILAIRLIAGGDGYAPLTPVTVKSARGSGANLVAMTDRFFCHGLTAASGSPSLPGIPCCTGSAWAHAGTGAPTRNTTTILISALHIHRGRLLQSAG